MTIGATVSAGAVCMIILFLAAYKFIFKFNFFVDLQKVAPFQGNPVEDLNYANPYDIDLEVEDVFEDI